MSGGHPLVKAFHKYIEGTIDYRIGVMGQVDAGKSALVNALAGADTHISTRTDATRTISSHKYGKRGQILDFPGVGTTEYSPKQYKKLIRKADLSHVLYVFSSKIREADEAIIRFLAKRKTGITFVYSKSDTLVDVSGARGQEMLMHDKDTELHVTFKKHLAQPLNYHFVSVRDNFGIEGLKAALQPIFEAKDKEFARRAGSAEYMEKFLNKRLNTLASKLLSPGLKDIILQRAYRSIEEMTEAHFEVSPEDGETIGRAIPRAADYINKAKKTDNTGMKSKEYLSQLATLFGTVFKLRKLNVISFIVSTLGEAGIKNIYPVLKGTFEYVGDMNDFAREILKHYSREQKEKSE
ncbi:hypothetical protein WN59_11960 [Salinicoccus sediminis]|uniref:G domain-containing protein n=1 Tax=Salinicoccus sediminis TaxID=1432562 RepID=A0A0M2SKS3_9STAP|nr:GTPase domain-containing protein [Salinicoccus sediminis]KKK33457.1 hypothetical protein WN59_11960 [Salinicoccus sediminis]